MSAPLPSKRPKEDCLNRMLTLVSLSLGSLLVTATPALAEEPTPPEPQPTNVYVEPAPPPATVIVPPAPPAPPPQPVVVVPQGTVHEKETVVQFHPGLIFGGAAIFGTAYGAAAITGAAMNDVCSSTGDACLSDRNKLYIPIAGPFMALSDVQGNNQATAKALLAVDGAVQIAGAAMSATGIIMSVVPTKVRHHQREASLHLMPIATPTQAGLGAFGKF